MKLGCLAVLACAALALLETLSFYAAHRLLAAYARELIGGSAWTDTLLPIIVVQTIAIVVGAALVKLSVAALPQALMGALLGQGGQVGRLVLRLIAGVLLILPGFFLDVLAIVLLLPPVQGWLAGLGQRAAMAFVRQRLAKMLPGAGPFPGMQPRPPAPETSVRGGRVIDATAERLDRDR